MTNNEIKDDLFDNVEQKDAQEVLDNNSVPKSENPLSDEDALFNDLDEEMENPKPSTASDDLVDTNVNNVVIGDFSDRQSYDINLKEDEEVEELEIKTELDNKTVTEKVKVSKEWFKVDVVDKGEERLKYLLGQGKQPEVFSDKFPDFKGFTMKLLLTYKDSNYASYIPDISWIYRVNTQNNTVSYQPSIKKITSEAMLNKQYTKAIQNLKIRVAQKIGVDVTKLKDSVFLKILELCEVRLQVSEFEFEDSTRTRLDWYDFRLDVEEAKKLL